MRRSELLTPFNIPGWSRPCAEERQPDASPKESNRTVCDPPVSQSEFRHNCTDSTTVRLVPWIGIGHWLKPVIIASASLYPFAQTLWGCELHPHHSRPNGFGQCS